MGVDWQQKIKETCVPEGVFVSWVIILKFIGLYQRL